MAGKCIKWFGLEWWHIQLRYVLAVCSIDMWADKQCSVFSYHGWLMTKLVATE